jgi:hypothetical protein
MHGADVVIGAEDGAEEAAAQMKAHGIGFEGEWYRLGGEVDKDDQDRRDGRDCLGLADQHEDVLVVAVNGDEGARVECCVAVPE